nr:hypothetical protein [Tanacetum cinerariifolium]
NYMPPKRDLRLIDEHFESVYVDVISIIVPSDVKTVKTIYVNHEGVKEYKEKGDGKGRISGKGKIKTGKLDFDDVYFCSGLGAKNHIGDAKAQTWFEATSKKFNEPTFSRVNTLGSGEDNIKHQELMEFCTNCLNRKEAEVSHDESEDEDHVPIPSSDPLPSGEDSFILNELMVFYTSIQEQRKSRSKGLRRLKKIGSGRRVKSPMEKDGLGAHKDVSKQGRMIQEIDQNAKIALDDETQGRTNDDEMFGVDDLAGEEVVMETKTGVKDSAGPTTDVTKDERKEAEVSHDESEDEDHVPIPSSDPLPSGEDSFILNELMVFYTSIQEQGRTNDDEMFGVDDLAGEKVVMKTKTGVKDSAGPTTDVTKNEDKGKAKMIKPEVPIKKKDQMRINEEYARKLEAEEQEAVRISRAQQDEEANNT